MRTGRPERRAPLVPAAPWLWPWVGLALLPHLVGLAHGFYRDDFTWLEGAFRSGASPEAILTPWKPGEFRPIAQALFWGEARVFGARPLGFNLLSLGLHGLAAILVWKIARRWVVGPTAAVAAAILFFSGLGHYGKPAAWACSQAVILGLILSLLALLVFAGKPSRPPVGRRLAGALALMAGALLSHEIYVLTPIGIALWSLIGDRPRRLAPAPLCGGLVGAYIWITLPLRADYPVAWGSPEGLVSRMLQYPAALILPAQTPAILQGAIEGVGAPVAIGVPLRSLLRLMVPVLGCGVLLTAAIFAVRTPLPLRWGYVFAVLYLIPGVLQPVPSGWVEARYLYPVAAFAAPLATAGLAAALARLRRAYRILLTAGIVLWSLGILAGTVHIQLQAWRMSRDAESAGRWEHLRSVILMQKTTAQSLVRDHGETIRFRALPKDHAPPRP